MKLAFCFGALIFVAATMANMPEIKLYHTLGLLAFLCLVLAIAWSDD